MGRFRKRNTDHGEHTMTNTTTTTTRPNFGEQIYTLPTEKLEAALIQFRFLAENAPTESAQNYWDGYAMQVEDEIDARNFKVGDIVRVNGKGVARRVIRIYATEKRVDTVVVNGGAKVSGFDFNRLIKA
jgi:hypothetical protein